MFGEFIPENYFYVTTMIFSGNECRKLKFMYYPNIKYCNIKSERIWVLYLKLQISIIDSKSGQFEMLDKLFQLIEKFARIWVL